MKRETAPARSKLTMDSFVEPKVIVGLRNDANDNEFVELTTRRDSSGLMVLTHRTAHTSTELLVPIGIFRYYGELFTELTRRAQEAGVSLDVEPQEKTTERTEF